MTDFLIQIFPYLIGLLGVAASFYTIRKTINNQREIKSIEIKKELRTKLLDDFIETYCELIKKYDELYSTINDYYEDIVNEDVKSLNHRLLETFTQINYYTSKMEMLLTKQTSEQVKILVRLKVILILVMKSNKKEIVKENGKEKLKVYKDELKEKQDGFLWMCSAYVEKERTAIENLISEKSNNKFASWIKKNLKEIKDYQP